ncbi:hypothetical protein BJV77DRAFT_331209 [Russula vinacea]|nr:hypothetical protein BJV77DRAFT_331209 [Russula vinacea]
MHMTEHQIRLRWALNSSEINQLRATLDQVQKELVQTRAQIDAIDARCTIMMQAAPEAREELEQQKCETCQAVKTSAPHVTATRAYRQWATEQEERAQQARDVEPHPQAMSQPYHSVKKLTLTSSPVLLVDGYIPVCFGPQSAERYFTCLLKSNTIPPGVILGEKATLSLSPPFLDISEIILPMKPIGYSTEWSCVVELWSLKHCGLRTPSPTGETTSKKRHCRCRSFSSTRTADPAFLSMSLLVGCNSLLNASISRHLAPNNNLYSHPLARLCRVQAPGSNQDETLQRNTVTLSKFAQHLGRSVDAFIKVRPPLLDKKTLD